MACSKEDGKNDCGAPESERGGVAKFEDRLVEAGETAGEGVLEIAAGEVLLEKANEEESHQPYCSVAKDVAAEQETAIDCEQAGLPESEDEDRGADDSPGKSVEEEWQLARAAESVDGVGTLLDAGHDPGDEECEEEGNALGEDHDGRRERGALRWVVGDHVPDDGCAAEKREENHQEDEEAPASPETVRADEDAAKGGGRRGSGRSDWRESVVVLRGEVFGEFVQGSFLGCSLNFTRMQVYTRVADDGSRACACADGCAMLEIRIT